MARVIVMHGGYGCDTGCCGHWVEVDGIQKGAFDFGHPRSNDTEAVKDYVRDLVTQQYGAEHVADIDWDGCIVVDD